ncbi:uncharacterized protein LOC134844941 [Symsagittifera roscoffensis]|uniref:uncharacterized protein LOC134844941 n=1 Tax=Symsagittifera roscoffensis TaxID=84072 RepID=UPI00307B7B3F
MGRESHVPKTIETTVNLHRKMYNVTALKRAPRAVKAIRELSKKLMGTSDVRIDTNLNKEIWSKGVNHIPFKVRVKMARKVNEDEDAKEPMYTFVSFVEFPKRRLGKKTEVTEDA